MNTLSNHIEALSSLSTSDKRNCVDTLIQIFKNITVKPDDPKYRSIKTDNKKFLNNVWKHEPGKAILYTSGWILQDGKLTCPPNCEMKEPLNMLLDERLKAPAATATEMVGVIIANRETEEEAKLRAKALKEKEQQLAAFKKDKEERKKIWENTKKDCASDREYYKVKQPARIKPVQRHMRPEYCTERGFGNVGTGRLLVSGPDGDISRSEEIGHTED